MWSNSVYISSFLNRKELFLDCVSLCSHAPLHCAALSCQRRTFTHQADIWRGSRGRHDESKISPMQALCMRQREMRTVDLPVACSQLRPKPRHSLRWPTARANTHFTLVFHNAFSLSRGVRQLCALAIAEKLLPGGLLVVESIGNIGITPDNFRVFIVSMIFCV